jgi:hypothetical protein
MSFLRRITRKSEAKSFEARIKANKLEKRANKILGSKKSKKTRSAKNINLEKKGFSVSKAPKARGGIQGILSRIDAQGRKASGGNTSYSLTPSQAKVPEVTTREPPKFF